jgi:uncharacterized RDD family membrane protein YckC
MTAKHPDENNEMERYHEERDLRSVMPKGITSHGTGDHSRDDSNAPAPRSPESDTSSTEEQRLPPVWPGDEEQPWFRRERGLPPLPKTDTRQVNPRELPTPLADISVRGFAFTVSTVVPNIIGMLPGLGVLTATVIVIVNLVMYRQGQDLGAAVFGLRVLRNNGDVAGFFHMWARNFASIVSLLALGAGFWTALYDPHRRTWHDRWLGTYVVRDAPEYRTRKRSSSETAKNWFWITLLLVIAASLVLALASGPVPSTTPPS